jgi:hypothetical protein
MFAGEQSRAPNNYFPSRGTSSRPRAVSNFKDQEISVPSGTNFLPI